ncbi:hypothetical protein JHK84_055744 [Glycine max]|nr:hypothetical protein JHK85_056709 [Glycine max]KAG5074513.1 hypothetical protein JHK84_055744 [Glycine max]
MQELAFDRLATNDAQDDDFLNSNDRVDLKIAPASDTGVSIGSHLKGAGVNYCGTEYDENCTYRSLTLSLQYFIECSMEDMMLLMIDGYSLESEPLPSSDLIETSRRSFPKWSQYNNNKETNCTRTLLCSQCTQGKHHFHIDNDRTNKQGTNNHIDNGGSGAHQRE